MEWRNRLIPSTMDWSTLGPDERIWKLNLLWLWNAKHLQLLQARNVRPASASKSHRCNSDIKTCISRWYFYPYRAQHCDCFMMDTFTFTSAHSETSTAEQLIFNSDLKLELVLQFSITMRSTGCLLNGYAHLTRVLTGHQHKPSQYK